jgi:hypothetical protein
VGHEPIDTANPPTVSTPLAQESPSYPAPSSSSASSSIPISRDNQTPLTSADETSFDAYSPSPPLITFTRLFPDSGPLSGGKEILAVGSGFRAEQELLIRFGHNNTPIATTFMAPNNLTCLLPPYHTAGPVIVTLHWPDKPESHLGEHQCLFTYEDLSARDV